MSFSAASPMGFSRTIPAMMSFAAKRNSPVGSHEQNAGQRSALERGRSHLAATKASLHLLPYRQVIDAMPVDNPRLAVPRAHADESRLADGDDHAGRLASRCFRKSNVHRSEYVGPMVDVA